MEENNILSGSINGPDLFTQQEPRLLVNLVESSEPRICHVGLPDLKTHLQPNELAEMMVLRDILIPTPGKGKSHFNLHGGVEAQQKFLDLRNGSVDVDLINKFHETLSKGELTYKPSSSYGNSTHSKARELRFIAKQNKKRKKKNKK